jgi:hypothetical protein
LSGGSLGNIPTTFSMVHTGDYNGDGRRDLAWRDNVGNTSIWFMKGDSAVDQGRGTLNMMTSAGRHLDKIEAGIPNAPIRGVL